MSEPPFVSVICVGPYFPSVIAPVTDPVCHDDPAPSMVMVAPE